MNKKNLKSKPSLENFIKKKSRRWQKGLIWNSILVCFVHTYCIFFCVRSTCSCLWSSFFSSSTFRVFDFDSSLRLVDVWWLEFVRLLHPKFFRSSSFHSLSYGEECWEKCGSKYFISSLKNSKRATRTEKKNWKIDKNLTSLKFENFQWCFKNFLNVSL